MKQLFEISCVAFKTFYVEADSEDDALTHPAVADEERPNSRGDVDWELDETTVKPVEQEQGNFIRKRNPEQVFSE